jgi:hypothetical protein
MRDSRGSLLSGRRRATAESSERIRNRVRRYPTRAGNGVYESKEK